MVAHFDASKEVDDNLAYKMNKFLPYDIAIHKIVPVKADAHARFSATSRTYHYYIITEKSPFEPYAYRFPQPLDFDQMNKAAATLFDYIDFTSFSKLHTDVKTNNCRIMYGNRSLPSSGSSPSLPTVSSATWFVPSLAPSSMWGVVC